MGQEIEIKIDNTLAAKENFVGCAEYRTNTIVLQADCEGHKISEDQIGATYFHELLHFCFDLLGEKDLRDNERIVGSLSELLYQAVKTAVF